MASSYQKPGAGSVTGLFIGFSIFVLYRTDTKNNIQILVDSNFNLYYYWNQAGEVF
jgi:hypothetical protein